MEKSWENFWTTGKVEDYLTYCNRVKECNGKEKERFTSCEKEDVGKSNLQQKGQEYATISNCNGYGVKHHAHF